MSDAHCPEVSIDEVERLLRICCGREALPAWLAVLRSVEEEIAIAADGVPLTVDVAIRGLCRLRIGVTPDGHVARLGANGPADARIEGDADAVIRFLLGGYPLAEALDSGLLVLPGGAPIESLARLRRIVARQLDTLLAGSAAVAIVGRRAAWRVREWAASNFDVSAVAQLAMPAIVAVSLLTHASAPVAPDVRPKDQAPAASLREVRSAQRSGENVHLAEALAKREPRAEGAVRPPSGHGRSSSGGSESAGAPVSASAGRRSGSITATSHAEPKDGRTWNTAGVEIECGDPTIRALVCEADGGPLATAEVPS